MIEPPESASQQIGTWHEAFFGRHGYFTPDKVISRTKYMAQNILKANGYDSKDDINKCITPLSIGISTRLKQQTKKFVDFLEGQQYSHFLLDKDIDSIPATSLHPFVNAEDEMTKQMENIIGYVALSDPSKQALYQTIDWNEQNSVYNSVPEEIKQRIASITNFAIDKTRVCFVPILFDTGKLTQEGKPRQEQMWQIYIAKGESFQGSPIDKDPKKISQFADSSNFIGIVRKLNTQ